MVEVRTLYVSDYREDLRANPLHEVRAIKALLQQRLTLLGPGENLYYYRLD